MKNFIINIKPFFIRLFSNSEQDLGKILKSRNLTISTTESCTGGLLSSRLTDISGSSGFVFKNFVTYSNEAKQEILKVKPETLKSFGAVSEQCAFEMAEGLSKISNCNISVATTGIAGPLGDENKPVGLVFIGVNYQGKTTVKKFNFNPKISRKNMKFLFSEAAISLIIEILS